jgi:hypothetical protein
MFGERPVSENFQLRYVQRLTCIKIVIKQLTVLSFEHMPVLKGSCRVHNSSRFESLPRYNCIYLSLSWFP